MTSSEWIAVIGISATPALALIAGFIRFTKEFEGVRQGQKNQRTDHDELKAQVEEIGKEFSQYKTESNLALSDLQKDVAVVKNDVGWIRSTLEKAGSK